MTDPPEKKSSSGVGKGQPPHRDERPNPVTPIQEVENLVIQARTGDTRAMGQLYRLHRSMVLALVWRFTGGQAETEDLVQDSFLRAFRNLDSFRAERATFRTWLYRITSNCCLDHVRRQKTRRTHMERLYLFNEEKNSPSMHSPETLASSEETHDLLHAAVSLLPAKQRMALILKHFQGLPIREIAPIMKCTEGTVKRHLYRAVRRLRKEMGSSPKGDPDEM